MEFFNETAIALYESSLRHLKRYREARAEGDRALIRNDLDSLLVANGEADVELEAARSDLVDAKAEEAGP